MKKKLLTLILGVALSVNFAIQANAETAGWTSGTNGWNYVKSDGSKATGWYSDNGTWYYFYSDGSMATGWIQSSGKWYYMLNDGSMATNTKVNGYYLDNDGAWSTNAPSTVYNGANIKAKLYGLGFVDHNNGLIINPYGANGAVNFTSLDFTVGSSSDRDMSLGILQSNSDVDKKVKTILNWILPTKGDYLYSVLDTKGLQSQTLQLDGRTITVRVQSYGIAIDFSPMS